MIQRRTLPNLHRLLPYTPWLLAAVTLLLRLVPGPANVDDAYITFRYARNLVEGHGFVYNAGEAVLGTTTPVWGFLLAAVSYVTTVRDFPLIALVLSALFDALAVVLLWRITLRLLDSTAAAMGIALVYLLCPEAWVFARSGMETALFSFLVLLALHERLRERRWTTAVPLALLPLVRPEGIFITALFLLVEWVLASRRRGEETSTASSSTPRRETAVIVGLGLAWLLFSYSIYGSVIPNSIPAKAQAYGEFYNTHLPWQGVQRTLIHQVSFLFGQAFEREGTWIALVPVALGLHLFGAYALIRRHPSMLPWLLFPHALVWFYGTTNPVMFGWYYALPVAMLLLGWTAALTVALRRLSSAGARTRMAALVVFVIVCMAGLQGWRTAHVLQGGTGWMWRHLDREGVYLDIGRELSAAPYLANSALVAAPEIGALGYAYSGPLLDTVGLVSPKAILYNPVAPEDRMGNYGVSFELIRDYEPDVIVSLDVFADLSLARNAWFRERYPVSQGRMVRFFGNLAEVQIFYHRSIARQVAEYEKVHPTARRLNRGAFQAHP